MPVRKGERQVFTPSVQGDDSWVIVRAATVGEIINAQRELEIRDNLWYRIGSWISRALAFLFPKRRRSNAPSDVTRSIAYNAISFIREWNWTDAKGEPLPCPVDEPSVVEVLTAAELQVVRNAISGRLGSEQEKN